METFTLSPTLSHLNGWEKKNHLTEQGKKKKKVFHSINQCLFVMSSRRSRFFFLQTLHGHFPSQCILSSREIETCSRVSYVLLSDPVISEWGNMLEWEYTSSVCMCVFVHVIYSTIFIIRQIKIHIFPCWFSIAKGASVTTLQDKARDSQAKFRCSHLVIIHIIIQFPHTDPCAWT